MIKSCVYPSLLYTCTPNHTTYVCHTIIKKLQNRINELSITLCGSASLSDHACPTYISCVKMDSTASQMLP